MAIDSVKELWERVGINVWMDDFYPEQGDDGNLYLITGSVYKKKTVDSYYREILENSLLEVCGLPMKIEIVVREASKEQPTIAFDKICGIIDPAFHQTCGFVTKQEFMR